MWAAINSVVSSKWDLPKQSIKFNSLYNTKSVLLFQVWKLHNSNFKFAEYV